MAAAFAIWLVTARAGADAGPERPRALVLLVDAEDDPLRERTVAELTAIGLDVQTIDDARPLRNADVDLIARTVGAGAAISVDAVAREVRVWVPDRAGGPVVLRATLPVGPDDAVGALRAVEALRTLLNRLSAAPAGAAPPPPSRPRSIAVAAAPEAPRSESARLGVSLAPALAASAGGFGASWQALLSARWLVRGRFGIEAETLAPITASSWREAEGSGTLRLALAAAGAHLRAATPPWCALDFGAGIGAAMLLTRGSGSPGFSSDRNESVVATPYVRAGYALVLTPSWRLRLDLASLVTIPRVLLRFGDRSVGAWGWPLVLGSAGVELVFPVGRQVRTASSRASGSLDFVR